MKYEDQLFRETSDIMIYILFRLKLSTNSTYRFAVPFFTTQMVTPTAQEMRTRATHTTMQAINQAGSVDGVILVLPASTDNRLKVDDWNK